MNFPLQMMLSEELAFQKQKQKNPEKMDQMIPEVTGF